MARPDYRELVQISLNEMKSEDTTLKQWDQKNLVPGNDTNLDVKINLPKHLHKIQSHKEGPKLYKIIFHFSSSLIIIPRAVCQDPEEQAL